MEGHAIAPKRKRTVNMLTQNDYVYFERADILQLLKQDHFPSRRMLFGQSWDRVRHAGKPFQREISNPGDRQWSHGLARTPKPANRALASKGKPLFARSFSPTLRA